MGKKKAKPLKVRCSFEPDRMALHYLKEAYEQLVPATRCTVLKQDTSEADKSKPKLSKEERAA